MSYEDLEDAYEAYNLEDPAWAEILPKKLTADQLIPLSMRAWRVLVKVLKVTTIGELLALDFQTVKGVRSAGVKTVREIGNLRKELFERFRPSPSELPNLFDLFILDCDDEVPGKAEPKEEQTLPEKDDDEEPSLSVPREAPVSDCELRKLSVRASKALRKIFPNPTAGDLFDLTPEMIMSLKNAGKKVAGELMALRRRVIANESDEPSASDFGSLSEMLIALDGTGSERVKTILGSLMGLLNSTEPKTRTLEECGSQLGVTRERVRQIESKIKQRLFCTPRHKALAEVEANVRKTFEISHNREVWDLILVGDVELAFGWTGTSVYSLRRLLDALGWKIVDLPDGRTWGWNEDGRFDWVKTYRPPTQAEERRAAIKKILEDAGYPGLTLDEVLAIAAHDYPTLKIGKGNFVGAMNGMLDDEGTRIIPYDRGTRQTSGTRYSLNTFFHDEQTKSVLEKAALAIRAYMEKTGLGVVSVWKASQKYQAELPLPLPKLGFYMMMRDFESGGLVYQDYPRIAYPGIKIVESTFPWMLYMYSLFCGRKQATFSEIMYFFTECLGIQPSIALSCAFNSMGLTHDADDDRAPYVLKPPTEGPPPSLLLPAIANYRDFSLIKIPAGSCYLDENGRALTYGMYAREFFNALEQKGFTFPADVLTGLLDRKWCKVHLKASHPVLLRESGQRVNGYWHSVFNFNRENYLVSSDWGPHNKSAFDAWATRIAALAGIAFEPYEITGQPHDEETE